MADPVGNPRGMAGVDLPNSPWPSRMKMDQQLMKQAGPLGNLNLQSDLPNSPWPSEMQNGLDMERQNSILEGVKVQGQDAWKNIKSGNYTPGDVQTLSIMVNNGLGGDEFKQMAGFLKSQRVMRKLGGIKP